MNVRDCQTVEQIHHDDDHEKDEDGEDEVAHPVGDVDVRVVHLAREHDDRFHQREPNISEVVGFIRTCACSSICWLSVVGSGDESERESKAEKEGEVGEKDEGVGAEYSGEHVDVEGYGSVRHNTYQQHIQLEKIGVNVRPKDFSVKD